MTNLSDGVTIKVNGVAQTITSATRQANHARVHYTLSTPAQYGDVVTWEYDAAAGIVAAESGGTLLGDVAAQSVTNNIPNPGDPIGDTLRADAIAWWKMNGDFNESKNGGNYNLTMAGSVGFTTGQVYTNAASFRSNTDELSIARANIPAPLNPDSDTASITFAVWFKPYDIPTFPNFHILIWSGAFNFGGYECRIDSNGQIGFHAYNGGGNSHSVAEQLDATPSDALNRWNLAIMQADSVAQKLTMTILPYNHTNEYTSWTFGLHPCAICDSGWFIGTNSEGWTPNFDIGPIGAWGRALTTNEVNYLWNSNAGRALYP